MPNRSIGLEDQLYEYILDKGLREPDALQRLRLTTEAQSMSIMRSAPEQGQFMSMLLKLMQAKRCLEIGTYTGYATLWMALSLPQDGEIITCDIDKDWTDVARRFWEEAGVADKINLQLGPALQTLDELLVAGEQGSFDLAFIDADKINYDTYYEYCLKLLRPGGLIIVDNVLWGGSVIEAEKIDADTEAIRTFNSKLIEDGRIELSMLPVADGLSLAMKRKERG